MVLVHYGSPETTRRCLESLARHEPFAHAAIVVDHGPGEGLGATLAGAHPYLIILPALDNPGFGAGCNRGARMAFERGLAGVWFLNNDAVVEGPMLQELVQHARERPEVAFWAHTQRDRGHDIGADGQPAWFEVPLPAYPEAPAGCRFLGARESLSGASLFLSKDMWDKVGAWPEDFFLYFEDAAYCHRAHRLGLPLAQLERTLSHDRGTTTGRRSALTVFYGVRNVLLLHRDLHPDARAARAWLGIHLLQKRFFQFRWGLLEPTWKGVWAAHRNRRGRDPRY